MSRTARSLACGWTSPAFGCHRLIGGKAAVGVVPATDGSGDADAAAGGGEDEDEDEDEGEDDGAVVACGSGRADSWAAGGPQPTAPTASPRPIDPRLLSN